MVEAIWGALAEVPLAIPTLCDDVTTEVAVVGLGGSGLAAVSELVRRGVGVVGIDAGQVAAGAAGRNGGFLLAGLAAFHHDAVARLGHERAVACFRETERTLAEMAAETPGAIRRTGSLRIATSPGEQADCCAQLEAMRADRLAAEPWAGPEGEGLLFPGDGSVQPATRCWELAARAMAGGAQLFVDSPVLAVEPAGVRTAQGFVRCRSVLVCVDGSLGRIVPELGGAVRSVRLQMLATAPLAGQVVTRPVYRRYGFDYYQQLAGGEVVLGGARDVGGDQEWTEEAVPSAPVQAALDELLGIVAYPGLEVTHRWAGIVGYTASGLPVVRKVREGLYAAGGYCGTGNVIGRIAGQALVELALDGQSERADLFDGPDGR